MAIRVNDAVRNKVVDVVTAWLSGTNGTSGTAGILKVYGGTQPAAGGTAGTQEILVLISPLSWVAASEGTASLESNQTGTAGTDGDAVWARLSDSSGTAYIIDGGCGTASTCDFVIDEAEITALAVIELTAADIVQPAS